MDGKKIFVNSLMGTHYFGRTDAFNALTSKCVDTQGRMDVGSFWAILARSPFRDCNIWSRRDMAERCGMAYGTFKNATRAESFFVKDGPVWGTHTMSLDAWHAGYRTAKDAGIASRSNHLRRGRPTNQSSGGVF